MFPSILTGVIAFVLWCVTDTSLNFELARNSEGKIKFWRIISLVLVQITLWALVGFSSVWIIPHLPNFFLTEWRGAIVVVGSSVLQWFALFMVLQYFWMLLRPALSLAAVATMAWLGSKRAKEMLDVAPWQAMSIERSLNLERERTSKSN
jgi:hypothetical protein